MSKERWKVERKESWVIYRLKLRLELSQVSLIRVILQVLVPYHTSLSMNTWGI